jgi:hypothetical protein
MPKRFKVVIEAEMEFNEEWYETGSAEEMVKVETANFIDSPEEWLDIFMSSDEVKIKFTPL